MKIKSLILLLSLCITTFASAQSYNNKNPADSSRAPARVGHGSDGAGRRARTKIPNKTNKAKSPLWRNILTELNIGSVEMKPFLKNPQNPQNLQNPPKLKQPFNQTLPSTASVIDTIWNFLTHRQ